MTTQYLTQYEMQPTMPKAALVVFGNSNHDYYLELHKIHEDGSMGNAQPVSLKFIQDLCEKIKTKNTDNNIYGFVPKNVLFSGKHLNDNVLVWYNEPKVRERYFVKELGLEDGKYHVPGTIYAIVGTTLYVWCFAGKTPKVDTPLLRGPFFNVYEDNHVCTGNAKLSMPDHVQKTYSNVMKFWENIFWYTIDSHTIGSSPSTKHNLIETIKQFKNKPFDTKELNPCKTTLEAAITKISKL